MSNVIDFVAEAEGDKIYSPLDQLREYLNTAEKFNGQFVENAEGFTSTAVKTDVAKGKDGTIYNRVVVSLCSSCGESEIRTTCNYMSEEGFVYATQRQCYCGDGRSYTRSNGYIMKEDSEGIEIDDMSQEDALNTIAYVDSIIKDAQQSQLAMNQALFAQEQ